MAGYSRDAVSPQIAAELELACQRNGWLCYNGFAWQDDPYLENYPYAFARARNIDDLTSFLEEGNWSIRQGIIYQDLAFIQQVDGGDEWWTLKRTDEGWLEFESLSAGMIINRDPQEFKEMVGCMNRATSKQCRHLNYMDAKEDTLADRAGNAREVSAAMDTPFPQIERESKAIE